MINVDTAGGSAGEMPQRDAETFATFRNGAPVMAVADASQPGYPRQRRVEVTI